MDFAKQNLLRNGCGIDLLNMNEERSSDEEDFSISESTVYRVLKEEGLIAPKPLPELPSAKEWRHKTTKPLMSYGSAMQPISSL